MDLIQQNIHQVYSTGKILSQLIYKICKVGQYLLVALFFFLLISLSCVYLNALCLIWLISGIWIQFNMIFNYTMCVMVRPGSPSNIQYSDISHIQYKCQKCNFVKPPRTHHCSMCGTCVLQMDHHCPWIGQCVGHHNRSYFMNFLVYTQLGVIALTYILNQYMSKQIFQNDNMQQETNPMLVIQIFYFIATLIVVLGLFNIFHWYLILSGKTTLECCFNDPRYTPSKSWLYNISLVFGTRNILSIFMPKFSVLKMKGFQWDTQKTNQNTSMIQIQHNQLQTKITNQVLNSKQYNCYF